MRSLNPSGGGGREYHRLLKMLRQSSGPEFTEYESQHEWPKHFLRTVASANERLDPKPYGVKFFMPVGSLVSPCVLVQWRWKHSPPGPFADAHFRLCEDMTGSYNQYGHRFLHKDLTLPAALPDPKAAEELWFKIAFVVGSFP